MVVSCHSNLESCVLATPSTGLVAEVTAFIGPSSAFLQRINTTTQRNVEIESANDVLRAQAMELTDRNSVLHIVEKVSGMALEIPVPLLKPW